MASSGLCRLLFSSYSKLWAGLLICVSEEEVVLGPGRDGGCQGDIVVQFFRLHAAWDLPAEKYLFNV